MKDYIDGVCKSNVQCAFKIVKSSQIFKVTYVDMNTFWLNMGIVIFISYSLILKCLEFNVHVSISGTWYGMFIWASVWIFEMNAFHLLPVIL